MIHLFLINFVHVLIVSCLAAFALIVARHRLAAIEIQMILTPREKKFLAIFQKEWQ